MPAEENLAANVRPSVAMLRLVVEFGGIVVLLRLPSDRSSKVPRVCPAPRLKVQYASSICACAVFNVSRLAAASDHNVRGALPVGWA